MEGASLSGAHQRKKALSNVIKRIERGASVSADPLVGKRSRSSEDESAVQLKTSLVVLPAKKKQKTSTSTSIPPTSSSTSSPSSSSSSALGSSSSTSNAANGSLSSIAAYGSDSDD